MKIKNISRLEYKIPYGWWVRIVYNRKTYSKFFSDTKYGGKSFSLLTAIAWKKKTKEKANIPDTYLCVTGAARSNTGIQGVSHCGKSNKYYVSWCDAEGKSCATSVSINKYGQQKALKLACAKRKEGEEWRLAGNVLPKNINKPKVVRDSRKYSKEELIGILNLTCEELGRIPTARDFRKTKPNYGRYEYAFGSWRKAIEAAGLKKA